LVLFDDVGAGDVARHQVRRELHPIKGKVQGLRHRLDHERLGQSRHADQEGMAAAQDRGEDPLHHLLLAHDPLGHLPAQSGDRLRQALELLDVVELMGGSGSRRSHRGPW
jgi:hypothetical protein